MLVYVFVEFSQGLVKYFATKVKNNRENCLCQEKFVFLYEI